MEVVGEVREVLVLDIFGDEQEVDGRKLRPHVDWRGLHSAAVREEKAACPCQAKRGPG